MNRKNVFAKPLQGDERSAARQDERFEQAFQEHWAAVHTVLMLLLGDASEAEDLALETFWRLYRRPPKDQQNLRGWLYRVATNLGYNALRARKRRAHYEEQSGEWHTSGGFREPEAQVEQAEERERVRRALARMKPRAAQMLVLRHSGLSYAEIAAALEMPASSVGTLLARAEREFEKRFEEGR